MRIVSLIRRADGGLMLQDRDGSTMPVQEVPTGSGYKVEGDGIALHSKGDEAILSGAAGDAVCRRAR
jgi:membrane-bound inhibitor of C-type lysozyme